MSDSAERIRAAQTRPRSYALSIVGCFVCVACAAGPGEEGAARGRAFLVDPEIDFADDAAEGAAATPDAGSSLGADAGAAGPDFDKDGLLDKVETKTGKFVSATDTGTDPREPDTDHDGMTDGEEVLGTAGGLDLPAMGVSPVHRNLLLEYDWFEDSFECTAQVPHSHRPTPAILAAVSAAFAGAPVDNPDGTRGITLIHDYGQSAIFKGGSKLVNPVAKIEGGSTSAAFSAYKKANFADNRAGYFHYVLMAHRYRAPDATGKISENSSGNAELPGNALMVTLACLTEPAYVSNTIMHELGHNLGLRHGGDENVNDKPNYNSVMNYFYQFAGVDTNCARGGDGRLDFSRNELASLEETSLYELKGICNNVPWDWNGVRGIESQPVKFDLNKDNKYTELHDFNDWAFVLRNKSLSRVVVDAEESPLCPAPPSAAAASPAADPLTPESEQAESSSEEIAPPDSAPLPSHPDEKENVLEDEEKTSESEQTVSTDEQEETESEETDSADSEEEEEESAESEETEPSDHEEEEEEAESSNDEDQTPDEDDDEQETLESA